MIIKKSNIEYAPFSAEFTDGCYSHCGYCNFSNGGSPEILPEDFSIFKQEVMSNLPILQKNGLLFSTQVDPCSKRIKNITFQAIKLCSDLDIPTRLQTKQEVNIKDLDTIRHEILRVGISFCGAEELEKDSPIMVHRIKTLISANFLGIQTFCVVSPIIDIQRAILLIKEAAPYCDRFIINLHNSYRGKSILQDLWDFLVQFDSVRFFITHQTMRMLRRTIDISNILPSHFLNINTLWNETNATRE